MILNLPLKTSEQANIVTPLLQYFQRVAPFQKISGLKEGLQGTSKLRQMIIQQKVVNGNAESLNTAIAQNQKYAKIAELLHRHINWNPQFGDVVNDLRLRWRDSMQPNQTFSKNEIDFDLYCVYYNLAILYIDRALVDAFETDLEKKQKEAIKNAMAAFYVLDRIRNTMEKGFVSIKFNDTSREHLEMLQAMALGIAYKCLLVLVIKEEFKVGLDKVAMMAKQAEESFYRAYNIASSLFMRDWALPAQTKDELLSFLYVEALYHQVAFNKRCADYYRLVAMDKDPNCIVKLIAHERKAIKLIKIAFETEQVARLLNNRSNQRLYLQDLLPSLQDSLKTHVLHNKEINKVKEVDEEAIREFKPIPPDCILKPVEPQSLKPVYDGNFTKLFIGMPDNESREFEKEMRRFADNKLSTLNDFFLKVKKNVETLYNDNSVNYYLNLNMKAQSGVPEKLRQKISQIKFCCGGKKRLENEMQIIKKSAAEVQADFMKLQKTLEEEAVADSVKRSQYGQRWQLRPSATINSSYYNDINSYMKKNKQADIANAKVFADYDALRQYIELLDGPDTEVLKLLPKMEITVFINDHAAEFAEIHKSATKVEECFKHLEIITDSVRTDIAKMNFAELASKNYRQDTEQNKQKIYDIIFSKFYEQIQKFNQLSTELENYSKNVAKKASELNKKNQGGNQNSRKQFQIIMAKFDAINSLFKDLKKGTNFYTRISQILIDLNQNVYSFVEARRLEASEFQHLLTRGAKGQQKFPALYNATPTPQFYLPPPIKLDPNSQLKSDNTNIDQQLFDLLNSKLPYAENLFEQKANSSRYP